MRDETENKPQHEPERKHDDERKNKTIPPLIIIIHLPQGLKVHLEEKESDTKDLPKYQL